MARLTREQLKLFGENGAASYFGKFGSKAAASPVTTKDIETIQGLSAWENGLQDACVTAADGSKAPFLEDINSLHYVHSYQQAYVLQEGIPEWEANIAYYKGSIVKKIAAIGVKVTLYCSAIDNNVNNTPPVDTSDTNWVFMTSFESGNIAIQTSAAIHFNVGKTTYIQEHTPGRLHLGVDSIPVMDLNVAANLCDLLGKPWRVYNQTFTVAGAMFYANNGASITGTLSATGTVTLGSQIRLVDTNTAISRAASGQLHLYGSSMIRLSSSMVYMCSGLNFRFQDGSVSGDHTLDIYNSLGQKKFYFKYTDGNFGYDGSLVPFSPGIREDKEYKDKKNLKGIDYLNWALKEAKKPLKPYKGIPQLKSTDSVVTKKNNVFNTQKEVDKEINKYGKSIDKVCIGTALWAEEAEKRLAKLESK